MTGSSRRRLRNQRSHSRPSMRGIASFYTTYLWFRELHQTNVWKGMLGAKIGLAAAFSLVFFVAMWASLAIADRIAPRFRIPSGPEDELVQRYRDVVGRHAGKVRTVCAVVRCPQRSPSPDTGRPATALASAPPAAARTQARAWGLKVTG